MREVLFRGKRTDNGEWVEGFLVKHPSAVQIGNCSPWYISVPPKDPDDNGGLYNVIPETIGEVVGLLDKNEKKMFEGDVVKGVFLFGMEIRAKVTFLDCAFGLKWYVGAETGFAPLSSICNGVFEIVGNVHDNPELLADWQDIRRADNA